MTHFGLGKIILLGEHAVVYGYPALAAALDRGVRIDPVRTPAGGPLRLDIRSWNLQVSLPAEPSPAPLPGDDHAFASGLAAIADALDLGRPPVTLVGDAQVPPGAGLGASAALAVAVARALYEIKQPGARPPLAELARIAGASEQLVHGNASGVDVALAAAGGIGVFRKSTGLAPIQLPAPLRVLVGPSGAPRSTARMVARVAEVTSGRPDDARLAELGGLADLATAALLRRDLPVLGEVMDRAHVLLGQVGVSTPLLDQLCRIARAAGAHGAKLTGAGGGGAVIAVAPRDREDDVLAAWKRAGVSGFAATVGGR